MIEELIEVYHSHGITDFTALRRVSDSDTGYTYFTYLDRQFYVREDEVNCWFITYYLQETDLEYDDEPEDELTNERHFTVENKRFEAVVKRCLKIAQALNE